MLRFAGRVPSPAVLRVLAFSLIAFAPIAARAAEPEHADKLGAHLPQWTVLPFVGILLSIAMFPLLVPRWWHRHFPKVSALWAIVFAVPFYFAYRGEAIHEILHIYFLDYFPFIILLWSLYTVAAGIRVKGTLK